MPSFKFLDQTANNSNIFVFLYKITDENVICLLFTFLQRSLHMSVWQIAMLLFFLLKEFHFSVFKSYFLLFDCFIYQLCAVASKELRASGQSPVLSSLQIQFEDWI